jgi:hypothetical protein
MSARWPSDMAKRYAGPDERSAQTEADLAALRQRERVLREALEAVDLAALATTLRAEGRAQNIEWGDDPDEPSGWSRMADKLDAVVEALATPTDPTTNETGGTTT